jgi:hypothetical protein
MIMTDMDSDPRHSQKSTRRYYGKYAGLVIDNGPPLSGGAHRGEIKVKVPGLLEETPDGSGNQALEVLAAPAFLPGFFFIPENNAQVWVEFVAGDINFPIWTGVWYPENATPGAADKAAPTLEQKVIRTRSGHVVEIDDTAGDEKIVIQDRYGNVIELANARISIRGKGAIDIQAPSVIINGRVVAPQPRPI